VAQVHAPAWQVPEAHSCPHVPQFWGSLDRSLQPPAEQQVCPAAQAAEPLHEHLKTLEVLAQASPRPHGVPKQVHSPELVLQLLPLVKVASH